MVSATRLINWRTEVSRSCVFGLPWKYLLATMLVAVCDQPLGTSMFSWRKITCPFSFPICAVRRSHSTLSNGEVFPSVKCRWNSSPDFRPASAEVATVPGTGIPSLMDLPLNADRTVAIYSSALSGSPGARGTLLVYSETLVSGSAVPFLGGHNWKGRNARLRKKPKSRINETGDFDLLLCAVK